ncbi:signal peptide peptidase SppA [Aeoliella mucimassa]|uniref:Protease 4 n=1 Tax=Aeoliella mucimassa TaxID=2527972 RepID=A0A518ASN4_9BACT|nr:signal peptide peptidase SppA [Aeoliella mucimassa]QDU57738.1 Protease 4 [Aeoliella mucimassa]
MALAIFASCTFNSAMADTAVAEKPAEKTEAKADKKEESKQDKQAKKDKEGKKEESKKVEKVRLALMQLSGALPESPGGSGLLGELTSDLKTTLERMERAANDDEIQGLVLKIDGASMGRGTIHEIREAIKRFRAKGKKVYAQIDSGMAADYLIASACDEISMPESGTLAITGVTMERMFYKGLLDKLGVEADFLHMGEAKGFAEPYTRTESSEPVRANLTAMIDDIYEQMVATVAFERPITREEAVATIDRGILSAPQAKELGLIDKVAYATELRQSLAKSYNTDNLVYVENYGKKKVDTDFSGPTGIFKLIKLMSGSSSSSKSSGKKIAIVYATGSITTGKSEPDLFGSSSSMGSTTIIEALRTANDDEDVAAIVLRINSPGGSALASDLMWSQIESLDKPIVASMGDVAASGGYYIAMGTDKILAEPTTITGSIGVVGGKMALGGLYDKLGLTVETISRGANSGVFSSTDKWTESERKAMREMMEDTYKQFTSKAAEGRGMPLEQLKKLAGGKVYTGRQAKANGLVDELGTLEDAISEAKKLAKIADDEEVKLMTLPEAPDFFESLFGNTGAEKEVKIKVDLGLGQIHPELKALLSRAEMLQRVFQDQVVLMLPYDLQIK